MSSERWQFAVCDEAGDMHEMPARMAEVLADYAKTSGAKWTVWRRRVQVGEWHRAEGGGR